MTDKITEITSDAETPTQRKDVNEPPLTEKEKASSTTPTGRRAAFQDLRRQLTDAELVSPGVQKLLLDMLEDAWSRIEALSPYVIRFHDADKKSAVLEKEANTTKSIEIFFGVGLAVGGTIIGLMPYFYSIKPEYGTITGVVGIAMIIGATVGRIIRK